MIEMMDIYKLECKKRMSQTEEELEKLIEIENEYKKYTNYNYLLREANNYRQRLKRIRQKTKQMLKHKCLFLTFTLKELIPEHDFIIEIKRYFKNACLKGYFNLDYGAKNSRLHAHALVVADYIDNSKKNDYRWNLGALNVKQVINGNNDYIKVAKYIAKLSNHSIKTSTKGRVIYFNFAKRRLKNEA